MNHRLPSLSRILVVCLAFAAALLFATPALADDLPPPAEPPAAPVEQAPAAPGETDPGPPADPGSPPPDTRLEPQPMALASGPGILIAATRFVCANDTVDGTPDGMCTGYTSITAAVSDFTARSGSGFIFAAPDTYTENVGVTTLLPNFTGLVSDGGSSANTTLQGYLDIFDQVGSLTLRGFTIQSSSFVLPVVQLLNNTGNLLIDDVIIYNLAAGGGMDVSNQAGTITLRNVTANGMAGIFNSPIDIDATKNVSLTNVTVNNNSGSSPVALSIVTSGGSIALNGVSVSNNSLGDGARLTGAKGVTIRNSMFESNSNGINGDSIGHGLYIDPATSGPVLVENAIFSSNNESGALIYTNNGAVTLRGVNAQNNGTSGVVIDNCLGGPCTASVAGNVSVTNTNIHSSLNQMGLSINASGNILLDMVDLFFNARGALLSNDAALSPRTVTVQRSRFANNANDYGLAVISKGAVTLNNVSSISNTGGADGIFISNDAGTAPVSILNTLGNNQVINNQGLGLIVNSKGAVIVNGLLAQYNTGSNAYIGNPTGKAPVTISRSVFQFSANSNGLIVDSAGAITLNFVTVTGNTADTGALLNNAIAILPARPGVTINQSVFDQNRSGLTIATYGAVNFNGVSASNNTLDHGALVDNCQISGGVCQGNGAVTIKPVANFTNNFNDNATFGIVVLTRGAFSASKLSASGNTSGSGLAVNSGLGNSPVTITDGVFDYNSATGLVITNQGNISLNRVSASHNTGVFPNRHGAKLFNAGGLGNVTILNSSFIYNKDDNLNIITRGSVKLNSVSANYADNGFGIYIENQTAPLPKPVTLEKVNASRNQLDNIKVTSLGVITLNGVSANDSAAGRGANLDTGAGGLVVLGTLGANTFDYNVGIGLSIMTTGPITIANASAQENGSDGFGLWNNTSPLFAPVSLTGVVATANLGGNIDLQTAGKVTVKNIYVALGSGGGMIVNNCVGGAPCPSSNTVTISNSTFENTNGLGLYVLASNKVTLSNVTASNNPNGGAWIVANFNTPSPVVVSNSTFNSNGVDGLTVDGNSTVTLTGVKANNNIAGSWGANVSTGGSVSVANSQFNGNTKDGLSIQNSAGTVSITSVTANFNTQRGIYVGASGNLSISKSTTNDNLQDGIFATSATGTITVSSTNANSNGSGVAYTGMNLLTNGQVITITGSVVMNNRASGILATVNNPGVNVTVKGTLYGGNDRGGGALDPNIVTDGILVILP